MLTQGVDSFVSVATADSYMAKRIDVAAWDEATLQMKEQALATATSLLNYLPWVGMSTSEEQSLAFPRTGIYFDPVLGRRVMLSGIPRRIEEATCELAYHLLMNDGLLDETGDLSSLQVGDVSLGNLRKPPVFPSVVSNLIRPLRRNLNAWWRAN